MPYLASETRYDTMKYNRTGRSGLKLPAISLGMWYNFGGVDLLENGRIWLVSSKAVLLAGCGREIPFVSISALVHEMAYVRWDSATI